MPVANPVDLWPALESHIGADVDVYSRALEAVLADPGVDAVFLHTFVRQFPRPAEPRRSGPPDPDRPGNRFSSGSIGRRDDAFAFQKEALCPSAFPSSPKSPARRNVWPRSSRGRRRPEPHRRKPNCRASPCPRISQNSSLRPPDPSTNISRRKFLGPAASRPSRR